MFRSLFSLALLLSVFVGCGTVRYSHIFQPQFSVSIINNTNVLIDVEINGEALAQNVMPGQTYFWSAYSFRNGDVVSMVAKGHDENGVFLGIVARVYQLFVYQGRVSEIWEIRGFSPPGR